MDIQFQPQKPNETQKPKEQIPMPVVPKQGPVQEPDQQIQAPIVGNEKGGAGPYFLAWLLGVPASLLILVAIFRAVF